MCADKARSSFSPASNMLHAWIVDNIDRDSVEVSWDVVDWVYLCYLSAVLHLLL